MSPEELTEKQKEEKAKQEYEEKINALTFEQLIDRGLINEALLRLHKRLGDIE